MNSESGNLFTGECDASIYPVPLTPENAPCLFVSIENPLAKDNGQPNFYEIVWGDSSRQRKRLLPGNSTEWMPIRDASQIYVRVGEGTDIPADATVQVTFTIIRKI